MTGLRVGALFSLCVGCRTGAAGDAAHAPAQITKYPIQLHRASHLGDRQRVFFSAEEATTTRGWKPDSPGAVETVSDTVVLNFHATATVMSLDRKGDGVWVTYDAATLKRIEKGALTTLFEESQVDLTRAPRDGQAIISVNGKPPSPEVLAALSTLLWKRNGAPTDDVTWGTTAPRAVGEHWPVDPTRWLSWLREGNDYWDKATVTGDSSLYAATRLASDPCLDVRTDIVVSGLPGTTSLGVLFDVGRKALSFRWLIPTDSSLGVLQHETHEEFVIKSHAPSSEGMLFEVTHKNHWDEQFTPL